MHYKNWDIKILSVCHMLNFLNQYSIAGYNGQNDYAERLPIRAKSILEKLYKIHCFFEVNITIPFASMIYFSTEDNKYINQYANTPRTVYDYFAEHKKNSEIV